MANPANLERSFREDLLVRLSRTDAARRVALMGIEALPDLAKSLGVQPDVLEEAAILSRRAFGARRTAILVNMPIMLHEELFRAVHALAGYHHMTPAQLIRALLHVVMQTTREPAQRPPRVWKALPGQEALRARLVAACASRRKRGKQKGNTRFQVWPAIGRGLFNALEQRATAYGARRARYVALWIADLVDGLLADLPIVPIDIGQLYDDERAYVLPVVVASGESCLAPVPAESSEPEPAAALSK